MLPYVRSLSDTVKRICSGANIRVAFTPTITLRQRLVHVKDSRPPSEMSGVVYCVPCSNCCKVYVEQTSRTLKARIEEHKRAVKYARTDSSALAEHVWRLGHQVAFDTTSILAQEPRLTQRLVLESWYIHPKNGHHQQGKRYLVNSIWLSVMTMLLCLLYFIVPTTNQQGKRHLSTAYGCLR